MSQTAENRVAFQRDETSRNLLEYANEHRIAGLFNDVTVKVGKENFAANRMVLSCYSKFFETMFKIKMKERYQEAVEIKGYDENSVKLLLDFIYTGNIEIDGENVMFLLAAANYMQLNDVVKFCFKFIESHLAVENCLDVLEAYTFYEPDLPVDHIYQFLSVNLREVLQQDNFKSLQFKSLNMLLEKLKQHRVDEQFVYVAIINWVKHEEDKRKSELPHLLGLLDLTLLSSEFLEEDVASEPLVKENIKCLSIVVSAMTRKFKAVRVRESGSNILCVGGNCDGAVVEFYSAFGNPSTLYPNVPNKVSLHSSAKLDNFIYCIGGAENGDISKTTEQVYQMELNKPVLEWKEVAPMKEKRCYFGATVFKKTLIVAGGCNKDSHLNSVELYNENSNTWSYIPKMKHERSGNGLVACEGAMYAIGGWADGDVSSSVERLDDLNGDWVDVKSMLTPRNCLAAVSYNGFIYVAGGHIVQSEKSVERYDPKANQWTNLKEMNIARYRHSACVLRGKIYVVGGIDATDTAVRKVECYDSLSDSWSIASDAPFDFDGLALVVV